MMFKQVRVGFRRGFTLIEIMVVVLVIGILAAMIIPTIGGKDTEAKQKTALSTISTLTALVEGYRLDMQRYPTEAEGLEVLRTAPSDDDGKWKGPYSAKPIPNDPWGAPYVYHAPAPNDTDPFGIESLGEDKAPGGEKGARDIQSWVAWTEEGATAPAGQ